MAKKKSKKITKSNTQKQAAAVLKKMNYGQKKTAGKGRGFGADGKGGRHKGSRLSKKQKFQM